MVCYIFSKNASFMAIPRLHASNDQNNQTTSSNAGGCLIPPSPNNGTLDSIISAVISAPDLQLLERTSNGTKQHVGQSFLQFSLRFVGRQSLSSGKPVHISLTATLQRRLQQDIQRGPYHCYCRGTLSCGPPGDVNAHEDRLGPGRHQAASHAPICNDLGVFFSLNHVLIHLILNEIFEQRVMLILSNTY